MWPLRHMTFSHSPTTSSHLQTPDSSQRLLVSLQLHMFPVRNENKKVGEPPSRRCVLALVTLASPLITEGYNSSVRGGGSLWSRCYKNILPVSWPNASHDLWPLVRVWSGSSVRWYFAQIILCGDSNEGVNSPHDGAPNPTNTWVWQSLPVMWYLIFNLWHRSLVSMTTWM